METRPGLKSTEFWITAAVAVLGMVGPALLNTFGSEDNLPDWAKTLTQIAGAGLAALTAMGYTVSRAGVKKAQLQAKSEDTRARADVKSSENYANSKSQTLLSLLLVCAFVPLTLGCVTAPPAFDSMTVGQISETINFEVLDFGLTLEDMEECGAPEKDINDLKFRHDAEIARLNAWLEAEEAKRLSSH